MKYKEDYPTITTKGHKNFNDQDSGTAFVTLSTGFKGNIMFDSIPCRYGGRRYYFICPCCQNKRMVLRLVNSRLICNHCINQPFKSTSITKRKRAAIKRERILKKLGMEGCDMSVILEWLKPKGMHWKTFHRLRGEYHQLLKNDALRLNASFSKVGLEPFYDGDDLRELM